MVHPTFLKKLSLAFTQVSDAILLILPTVETIEWIDLFETQVTEAGVENLKTRCPDLDIHWQ